MAPKANNKWSDVQMAIAAISMTSVIAFWNMFAGPDKVKADEKAAEQALIVPPTTVPTTTPEPEPTLAITMPPVGYKILFGGVAPQPQVIVKRKQGGGGNKNNEEDNGGGGGGAPSQPPASTGSS
ncbi:MAG TPA: hypothetical protein PKL78_08535 [Anaerolineales bacterium]|nr:hypothetical protein [Anaerolineales bacterium]HNN13590.1 hypothetical protein [Anaerolineales bacterium]